MVYTAAGSAQLWSYCVLWGPSGVANAACVTNLPTDPDCALHTMGLMSLMLLWKLG